jgi:hypothetical protein
MARLYRECVAAGSKILARECWFAILPVPKEKLWAIQKSTTSVCAEGHVTSQGRHWEKREFDYYSRYSCCYRVNPASMMIKHC